MGSSDLVVFGGFRRSRCLVQLYFAQMTNTRTMALKIVPKKTFGCFDLIQRSMLSL